MTERLGSSFQPFAEFAAYFFVLEALLAVEEDIKISVMALSVTVERPSENVVVLKSPQHLWFWCSCISFVFEILPGRWQTATRNIDNVLVPFEAFVFQYDV
jgi:hypothetical protein